MAVGHLDVDLAALTANYHALNSKSDATVETAAVVKADAYGLGIEQVGPALKAAGAKTFFVAAAEEGVYLRRAIGPMAEICVFSGHMTGDAEMLETHALTPMVNSIEQLTRQIETLPGRPFGVQLDTGMNRLGMEDAEWAAVRDISVDAGVRLIMSHLACADEPDHPMNAQQLFNFRQMTDGLDVRRSLAATGGILLGSEYHFDLTRPGVGLYGGLPFADANPVAHLSLPVIQTRVVEKGESVGYGAAWVAQSPRRIATLAAGYADGLIRAMSDKASLYADGVACPLVGRVSMDMIAVDVTDVENVPESLEILGPNQGVDTVADAAGTIGYEILTSLGYRFRREHIEGPA